MPLRSPEFSLPSSTCCHWGQGGHGGKQKNPKIQLAFILHKERKFGGSKWNIYYQFMQPPEIQNHLSLCQLCFPQYTEFWRKL